MKNSIKPPLPTSKIQGFFNTHDDTKIYYEVYGSSGPVLVLTYGIACLINHWHYQIEEFAKDHRVLVYDIRGHHKSEMGNAEPTIDLLAQDSVALFTHLFPKEKNAHFWGHSFGAPVSFRAASLFPEKVKSLTMINGFYKNPFSDFVSLETALQLIDGLKTFTESAPLLSKWLWAHTTDNLLFHYLAGVTGGFNLERAAYKDIQIYSKGLAVLSVENFCKNFKALLKFDGSELLSSIKCPTLIVHGARDGIVPLKQNQELFKMLPNSEYLSFEEGSHCTQLDLPKELNQELRKFLKK